MNTGILLESILPKSRIKSRLIDIVAYASDAGFYYLRPKAVIPQKMLANSKGGKIIVLPTIPYASTPANL